MSTDTTPDTDDPTTDALDDIDDQTIRAIAREVKRDLLGNPPDREQLTKAVLQQARDMAAAGAEGFREFPTRRDVMIAGGSVGAAVLLSPSMTGTALANAKGELGTQTDPWVKAWVHTLQSGDGQSNLQVNDTVLPATASTYDLGASGTRWSTVYASTVNAASIADDSGNTVLANRVASGSVTLSSGAATVDTGVGVGTTATFYVALGPDTDDAEVAATIKAPSGGNYTVHIDELNTSVGNPSIRYDIVRVR